MKRTLLLAIGLCLLVSSCAIPARDTVFQTSIMNASATGGHNGEMTCHELRRHGNFGIGTFDHLGGEMVLLKGKVYQIEADGRIRRMNPSDKVPLATVCQFKADRTVVIRRRSDYEEVKILVNENAPHKNLFYAIKITGQFKSIHTRSGPAREETNSPSSKAGSNQPEFRMNRVSGTIVGFLLPSDVKGANEPEYHLHFLSSDRTQGGHVLSFEITDGKCEIDALDRESPEGE
ncbi:MAG: acetolactate decarboxylase [Lentisphaeria bacterium]|nr:acetolactate decarboxylase [Lentisphaeria bacterium]